MFYNSWLNIYGGNNNNDDATSGVEGVIELPQLEKPKKRRNVTLLHCFCCKMVWKPKFTDFKRHLDREPTPDLDENVEEVIRNMFKMTEEEKKAIEFSKPLTLPRTDVKKKKKEDDDIDLGLSNLEKDIQKREKMLEEMNRVLLARERAVMNV